jgi:hypothetical protein
VRGGRTGLVALAALLVTLAGLGSGSAAAAGNRKLIEGTVYDTTCATSCVPECPPPPHCGPITVQAGPDLVCAQRRIVCPLYGLAPRICLQGSPCGGGPYPVYSGEGAVINVRKRGSAKVLATLPAVEGHFKIRLGPGDYVLHPYLPKPGCWSGEPVMIAVEARLKGPLSASIDVSSGCCCAAPTAP